MRLDEIEWEYQGNSVRVGMTWHGQGASVLMLPALSSISTRSEMWPLQERLGSWFTTLAIDWVGFGDRPRPPLRWSPEIYRSFLAYLLTDVAPRPFATIAAGHAAAYCLDAAAAQPGSTAGVSAPSRRRHQVRGRCRLSKVRDDGAYIIGSVTTGSAWSRPLL